MALPPFLAPDEPLSPALGLFAQEFGSGFLVPDMSFKNSQKPLHLPVDFLFKRQSTAPPGLTPPIAKFLSHRCDSPAPLFERFYDIGPNPPPLP